MKREFLKYLEKTQIEKYIILLDKGMSIFENVITTFAFVSMTCLVLAGVISRFILHIPFKWVEEASRYLMITGIYIGISMGVKQRKHLGFTFLLDAVPNKFFKNVLNTLRSLIEIIAYAYFAYCSISFCLFVKSTNQISPALLVPMWYVYVPLVVGFIFCTIRALMVFYNNFNFKE